MCVYIFYATLSTIAFLTGLHWMVRVKNTVKHAHVQCLKDNFAAGTHFLILILSMVLAKCR